MGPIDGRQVKAARAILGITQGELARASGVHKNTVYRAEGSAAPIPALSAIGSALQPLGISFDQDGATASVSFPVAFEKQSTEINP